MCVEKNKEIYLIAGFNRAYLEQSETYLATMNDNSKVNNVIMTLDFDIPSSYKERFGSIRFIKIKSSQIKSPNLNTCMQHGGFLEALDFVKDDAVIIYTDTDIKIQRPFNESELQTLISCEDGQVFINFNTKDRLHLRYFDSIEEFFEIADYYLDHEEERKTIADQGMNWIHQEYNCQKIAQYILELIENGHCSAPWNR